MVPGAPVGFWVGSLDMGVLRAKDAKKEEKVEAVETGDKKIRKTGYSHPSILAIFGTEQN